MVLSSALSALAAWLVIALGVVLCCWLAVRGASVTRSLDAELADQAELGLRRLGHWLLWLPVALCTFETVRFAVQRSAVQGVSLHGYLPYITSAVVLCLCAFLWLTSTLRASHWYLASAVQLFVASATLLSCVFQDEIPYTFARLVSSVQDLPNHVGTVRFFMFFAASLCTLPATLGMAPCSRHAAAMVEHESA